MKSLTIGKLKFAVVAPLAVVALTSFVQAQSSPIQAEVRAIKGTATYSVPGGPAKPLQEGMNLIAPTTIKTGPESVVDLYLGSSAGLLRIAQNSSLSLDKLTSMDTGADSVVEAQMNLPKGQIFFDVNKLSQASRYEIKVPNGVAGIRGTAGGINDGMPQGVVPVLPQIALNDGRLLFVHVPPPPGQPTPYTLTAPPPQAWTATGGVQPATPDIIKYVGDQIGDMHRAAHGEVAPPPRLPPIEPFVSTTVGK